MRSLPNSIRSPSTSIETAARQSFFGGLAASGWYTAAVTMRLLTETGLKPAGGYIGAGADGFRWPRPVRPGDELRVECEVVEVRPSASRPDRGLIKVRTTALNQDDEITLTYIANMVVLRQQGDEPTATTSARPLARGPTRCRPARVSIHLFSKEHLW